MRLKFSSKLKFGLDVVTQTIAFIARKGWGKSYAAMKLAELMLKRKAQVIILDVVGNWWALRLSKNGHPPGLRIYVFGGDRGDAPLAVDAGAKIARLIVERNISAVLDVSSFRKAERKRFAADFAEEFFHLKKSHRSPVHVFLEEAQKLVPQNPEPDERRMLGAYEDIARLGRNYGIGISFITQRPQSVNKEVLSQVELLIVGQMNGTHERKAINEWVQEKDADRELVGELPSLERGEAIVWSPGWLKWYGRTNILEKTTFDASATPTVGHRVRQPGKLSKMDLKALELAPVKEEPKSVAAIVADKLSREVTALKAKIVELEAKPKRVPKVKPPPPILKPRAMKRFEKLVTKFERHGYMVDSVGAVVISAAHDLSKALTLACPAAQLAGPSWRDEALLPPRGKKKVQVYIPPESDVRDEDIHSALTPPKKPDASPRKLKKGAVTMLERLRSAGKFQLSGLTREELGVQSCLGYKTGTFSDYLSALRGAGLVREEGGKIYASQPLEAKGPLPTSTVVIAAWSSKLKAGARRMLDVLVQRREDTPVTRNELGELSGISPTSGTFSDYLSLLRRNGLIEEQDGIYASPAIFLGDA